ncbi:MAG: oxygen-independent coproporphyrinogen III oxidase [Deltaproteobacteria bacterium]|nr:oxygen-independent coproporphyrinogen III oxidase [Deltaproteobacteria bacterium]
MVELTPELITRLDRPGPRYTSYPTANLFSEVFTEEAWKSALTEAGKSREPFSLYVHLPFCEQLCTYCACNVVVRKNIRLAGDPYLERVFKEAEMAVALVGDRPVGHLHLGGGTPNYLEKDQMEALMGGLKERFNFLPDAELAIEVDPRHFEEGQLEWLHALGFRRASFGLQDVEPSVQVAIGREQTVEQTERAFKAARKAGFGSINMDLVYGLPTQTLDSFHRTVKKIVELGPDRLAIFSFAYVPQVKPHQTKLDTGALPAAMEKASMLADCVATLTANGYVQVGMDHYAKEGDALATSFKDGTLQRNFQGYVPGPRMEILGLGATAISDFGGAFAQNHHKIKDYDAAIDSGHLPLSRGWTRTFEDEVRRSAIHDLMCTFRLDFGRLKEKFDVDHDTYFADVLPGLDAVQEQQLIERDEAGIKVTELGRLFVRNVAMLYDGYLKTRPGNFSRTV